MDEQVENARPMVEIHYRSSSEDSILASATMLQPLMFEGSLGCHLPGIEPADGESEKTGASESLIGQESSDHDQKTAIEEAHRAGFQEGKRIAEECSAQVHLSEGRRVEIILKALGHSHQDYLKAVETQIPILALAIAEHVLRREIGIDKRMLATAVFCALEGMSNHLEVTLQVPREDEAYWISFVREMPCESPHIVVLGDALMTTGQCQCHLGGSWIDLGIDAQLNEIKRCLNDIDRVANVSPLIADESQGISR